MAQENNELKNSYEIWWYKSVEELASEVEKKNKDLAEKIRTNAKKQILEEWKDWRISLKDELTPDDEKALREALPDSDVQSYFNEGMTTQEKALLEWQKMIDSFIPGWKEISKKIDWAQSIKNWYEAASELFEKWDYWWAAKIFLASFAWWFSLEAWHKKDDPKETEETNTKEKWKEIALSSEYNVWLKILYMIWWNDLTKKCNWNLSSPQIRNSTFNDLLTESKNPNWIAQRLSAKVWINSDYKNDDEIMASIEILKKS